MIFDVKEKYKKKIVIRSLDFTEKSVVVPTCFFFEFVKK